MQTVRTPPEIVGQARRGAVFFVPHDESRGFWDRVRRHPLAVIIPCLIGAVAGGAVGYARKPVFTASVPMVITQVNSNAPGGLGGYAAAAPQLANVYSRMATSQAVLKSVEARLHLSSDQVSSRLSASQVPGNAVFYLRGQAANPASAIRLVNTASVELARYVRSTTAPSPTAAQLLGRYRVAQKRLQTAVGVRDEAQGAYDTARTAEKRRALADARGAVELARVEASSLEDAYRNLTANNLNTTNLHITGPATEASSSRRATVQMLGVLGGVAGLVIGLAFAWLIGGRTWRRNRI